MIVNRLSVSATTLLVFCGMQICPGMAAGGSFDPIAVPFQLAQATPAEDPKNPPKKPEPRPAPPQQQPRAAPPAAERREPSQPRRDAAPERRQAPPERQQPERRQVQPQPQPQQDAPTRRDAQPDRNARPPLPPVEKRAAPSQDKRDAAPPERRANPAPQPTPQPTRPSVPVATSPPASDPRPIERRAAPVVTPPNPTTSTGPVPNGSPQNAGPASIASPARASGAGAAPPPKPGAPAVLGVAAGAAVGAVAGAAALGALAPPVPKGPQAQTPPQRFDEVQKGRQQRVEDGGRRTVIQEPGNRVIIKQDNRIIIQHDEAERFRRVRDSQTQRRPDGIVETFHVRPDGFRVVSEVDGSGRLLRRYRRGPDGREFGIIDNRRFYRNAAIGVGIGAIAVAIALNLQPPRISIPRERYIVEYDRASDDDLYEALTAPPVERLERSYSLEEVRYSYELREHMRRVDLNDVTFDFGAYEIAPDQYRKLERIARSILRALRENPEEVFLVEGHTDAVGSDVDNLSLSDRRAGSVAQVLSETFGVPPENLITQGYGEQYLKIKTQDAERANRRVAIRRITPLMAER